MISPSLIYTANDKFLKTKKAGVSESLTLPDTPACTNNKLITFWKLQKKAVPFSRNHAKFKKGTVNFVPDAVKPLHLLGNICFNGFDIYGMLHILLNILPPFSKHSCRKNGGKIENTHSITNFSELISKVCINYGSPCWTRTNDLRINSPSLYRLS